jgi:diguanylate cyclase (GGDEF)-like protein
VTFGFLAVITYLDGGLRSPFLLLLFLSMQYVAMAYPVSGVLGFSVAADVMVVWLGLVRPDGSSTANTAMVTLVVGIAGLLSALAARNREIQQEKQHELNVRLAAMANEDALTGCLNRRRFDVVVADELARAVRHDRQVSLLILDIDGFKSINDTHGHPVGDAALRALAGVLRDRSRRNDSVARLGGDEFAIVLPDTDPSEAEEIARRLLAAIAEIDDPLPIVTSIGVAGGPGRLIEAEELVSVADAALYRVKAAGRRGVAQSQAESSMPPTNPITTVSPLESPSGQPTLMATMGSSESLGQ